ncbi:hypothetical protein HMPREF3226_02337 [Prevotella corporis]|uniref:Uncharacterized protein n=1 Tax=Prevotella corporis TaxID=28128 RepID=A0A133PWC0_9BACT|nr:hypothetical protein HMPREF3226_02337 [Prevotella corporis]
MCNSVCPWAIELHFFLFWPEMMCFHWSQKQVFDSFCEEMTAICCA